jgi:hypothetical protein
VRRQTVHIKDVMKWLTSALDFVVGSGLISVE